MPVLIAVVPVQPADDDLDQCIYVVGTFFLDDVQFGLLEVEGGTDPVALCPGTPEVVQNQRQIILTLMGDREELLEHSSSRKTVLLINLRT